MDTKFRNLQLTNGPGSLEIWLATVRKIIGPGIRDLTCLDLCCNEMTGTRLLPFKDTQAVDLVDWPTRPREYPFVCRDALDFCELTHARYFDVAICSDGIEHLSDKRGRRLIEEAKRISDITIFFTPLGPYMLDPTATSPDAHKSSWLPEDFPSDWHFHIFPEWHTIMKLGAFFAWKV